MNISNLEQALKLKFYLLDLAHWFPQTIIRLKETAFLHTFEHKLVINFLNEAKYLGIHMEMMKYEDQLWL